MSNACISEGAVLLANGVRVTLPLKAVQLVEQGEVLVVRGEGPRGEGYVAGNLWGLSRHGEILWQITKAPPLNSEFVDLELQNGRLIAFNFNGYRCDVDGRTGAINSAIFTK